MMDIVATIGMHSYPFRHINFSASGRYHPQRQEYLGGEPLRLYS